MGKAVATELFPEGPDDKANIEIRHTDMGERSRMQIEALLAIRNESSRFLCTKEEIGVTVNMDPEALNDARDTYTLTGVQLRNIVDDMRRWTLEHGKHEADTLKLLEMKQNEVKGRQEHNNRPCVVFRPRIAQMPLKPDNRLLWVVWLGDGDPQQNGLFGIGLTAEEAMTNFDKAYVKPIIVSSPVAEPVQKPLETMKKAKAKRNEQ